MSDNDYDDVKDKDQNSNEDGLTCFVSEAPARLCLFGEHQDYLGLPVIACAIPLYCRIQVRMMPKNNNDSDHTLKLFVPQLSGTPRVYDLRSFPAKQTATAQNSSLDFAQSALYEAMHTMNWSFQGCGTVECVSTTEFPMQAGISSSSAFCVAFCHVLAYLAGQHHSLTSLELAKLAHTAEVTHFDAPGGTMDHVTCAIGGLVRIGPGPWEILTLEPRRHGDCWVLVYSGEPKDTLRHLHRCKNARLTLREKLGGKWPDHMESCSGTTLTDDERELLQATLVNRDMEELAYREWDTVDGVSLGDWMQQHHDALRDGLQLSTPRLEALSEAAHAAGAWGFKVVGSGGGGCGVAWTSAETSESVAWAMQQADEMIQTWILMETSSGARLVF